MKILLVTLLLIPGLAGNAVAQGKGPSGLIKVWSGSDLDLLTGDVSPDGGFLSDINWDSGDLDLIDLKTGKRSGLTGEGYANGRYAWKSAFSNDGNRIAVSWFLYKSNNKELRVINRDGTGSRVLFPATKDIDGVEPLDWSPEDKEILVALWRHERLWEIGLLSVSNGEYRRLKTLSWLSPGGEQSYPRASFSPDGKYVSFDYRPDLQKWSRAIYLLATGSGIESRLIDDNNINRFVGWTQDGNEILFYSDRGGTHGIWKLSVQNGKAESEPELVITTTKGLVPLGDTNNGFAFGRQEESPRVHVAKVNFSTGRVLSPAKSVYPQRAGTDMAVDFSPDGKKLAFIVHESFPERSEKLVIRTLDNGSERTRVLPPDIHTSRATLRWVDERTIILFAAERGSDGIYRLDPLDGSMNRLPEKVLEGFVSFKWFEVGPKGRRLFTVLPGSTTGNSDRIVARDIETGSQVEIATADTDRRTLAVSPDGEELAYLARDKDGKVELRITSTSIGGDTRTLHRISSLERFRSPIAWTPDGKRIVLVQEAPDGSRSLVTMKVMTEISPLKIENSDWCCIGHELNFHPDGKRIALIGGKDESAVWVLTRF